MELRKYIVSMVIAMVFYVVISLILEGEFTKDLLIRESGEGLIFGILYGLYLFLRKRFIKKKET